jgi:hypothetical protein
VTRVVTGHWSLVTGHWPLGHGVCRHVGVLRRSHAAAASAACMSSKRGMCEQLPSPRGGVSRWCNLCPPSTPPTPAHPPPQRQCTIRDHYMLDYDSFFRDVRSMREKHAPNMVKLAKKEAKLAEAEARLDAFSEQLVDSMRALLLERDSKLLPQLRQVRGVQVQVQVVGDWCMVCCA